jgi:sugar phosphate isomerase/epimerase
MDILLKGTDPSLVTFEMDAGWVTAAGHDPFAMLKKHPGRFTQMHVKDIKATTQANFVLKQDPTEVGERHDRLAQALARRLRGRCPRLLCRAGAAVRP